MLVMSLCIVSDTDTDRTSRMSEHDLDTAFDAQFNCCALITSSSSCVRGPRICNLLCAFGKGGAALFKPASPLGMPDAASIIGNFNFYFVTSYEQCYPGCNQ